MSLSAFPGVQDPSFNPVVTNHVEAGAVYTSFIDRNLVARTEALHRKGLLSRRSFMWPFPDGAPAIIVSTTTAADFEMPVYNGGTDLMIPWRSHDGVTHVGAEIYVAIYDKYTRLRVNLQSKTLVSSAATATGNVVEAVPSMSPSGLWTKEGNFVSIAKVRCFVQPTYPADRRIAITVQGTWAVFDADGSPFSNTRQAKIVSMKVFDALALPKRS